MYISLNKKAQLAIFKLYKYEQFHATKIYVHVWAQMMNKFLTWALVAITGEHIRTGNAKHPIYASARNLPPTLPPLIANVHIAFYISLDPLNINGF